jgi:hypothetical protein
MADAHHADSRLGSWLMITCTAPKISDMLVWSEKHCAAGVPRAAQMRLAM